jgi:hypothetical protein
VYHKIDKIYHNRQDISQNTLDISQNRQDISQNTLDISQNTLDISDISSNKDFIRHLQSVNYTLLDPLPDPSPNPPIKSGYNGVLY